MYIQIVQQYSDKKSFIFGKYIKTLDRGYCHRTPRAF